MSNRDCPKCGAEYSYRPSTPPTQQRSMRSASPGASQKAPLSGEYDSAFKAAMNLALDELERVDAGMRLTVAIVKAMEAARVSGLEAAARVGEPGSKNAGSDTTTEGDKVSQTEKAIVAMLRSQVNSCKSKAVLAVLLRNIRMIEAGAHHEK